ncbi:permease [Paenibacillus sp. J23TS9]|uniref:MFS transporter n=1 Tax=Paenibacillus sp. J23TS9 TaxID=2807193 RepID=UPI001B1F97DD|nr:MFS transporter [Paenibacillus sp. J23TS9]GIP26146.1 permease [Paenibacillus sp. J23TS9]
MKNAFKIALLSLALTSNLAPLLAAPAIKLIGVDFPDASPVLVQLIVTFASFFVVPALLSVRFISTYFSKKTILLFGLLLYIIGGVGPAFMHSVTGILVFRAVLGISIGLVTTMLNTLIAEHIQGNERIKMNGLIQAISGLGGAFFLSLGGNIAALGWRGVFLTYSYAIILAILVLLFIPRDKPGRLTMKSNQEKPSRLPAKVYGVSLGTLGILILYYAIPTNLAVYMADNGFGNATATGYVTAVSLLAIFIGGLCVRVMAERFKQAIIPLVVLLYSVSFVMISVTHLLSLVILSVSLIGFGFGIVYPMLMGSIMEATPKSRLTSGISMLLIFTYLGQFVTPIVLNGIHLIGISTLRGTFLTLGIITGIAFILVSVYSVSKSIIRMKLDSNSPG